MEKTEEETDRDESRIRSIRLRDDVYEELKARKPRGVSWDYLFRGFLNLPA